MRKLAIVVVVFVIALCGCTSGEKGVLRAEDSPKPDVSKRFICDDGTYRYETIVDKQTGVTYLVVRNGDNIGITPLLNRNGYPIITSEEVGE